MECEGKGVEHRTLPCLLPDFPSIINNLSLSLGQHSEMLLEWRGEWLHLLAHDLVIYLFSVFSCFVGGAGGNGVVGWSGCVSP